MQSVSQKYIFRFHFFFPNLQIIDLKPTDNFSQ